MRRNFSGMLTVEISETSLKNCAMFSSTVTLLLVDGGNNAI